MEQYEPNFADPRVIARCRKVLAFIIGFTSTNKENFISQKTLIKYFGSDSNPLSIYLKKTLLKCTDHYYSKDKKQAKKYSRNKVGFEFIFNEINKKAEISHTEILENAIKLAYKEHEPDLTLLGQGHSVIYKCIKNRYFNNIQNLPSHIRTTLLKNAGLSHHYDIECSAQTMMYQYAKQLGLKKILPYIELYLSDRTAIRNQIAEEMNLDLNTVKVIITSIFTGAKLGCNCQWALSKLLDFDYVLIKRLNECEFISNLKKELSILWAVLKTVIVLPPDRNRINASDKANLYRELEIKVVNVIVQFFKDREINYFLIHDGWVTDKELNLVVLNNNIIRRTGLSLKIEYQRE